jgi:pimeloyl-ACP methyl ester carboxylesterase
MPCRCAVGGRALPREREVTDPRRVVEAVRVEVVRVDVGGGVVLSCRRWTGGRSNPGEQTVPARPQAGGADTGPGPTASAPTRATGATASGPRPPVVLLPGTGLTARDWDDVAGALAQTRTTHAVDLRGHGGSDRPGTYSIALMAADVRGLLDALAAQDRSARVDLVGHSLGGLVACLVAAGRPDRVRRLVLEDVGLLHPRPPAAPSRPEGGLDFDWAVVEQVRPEIDDPDPAWPDVVRAVVAPTLVVGGGPTSSVPQDRVRELAATLRDGTLATLDTGHLVHASDPGRYVALVEAFLDA